MRCPSFAANATGLLRAPASLVGTRCASCKQALATCSSRLPPAETQLDSARKDAAESRARADEARAAGHRLELEARSLQEERDSAIASTDTKQREVDRLTGSRRFTHSAWNFRVHSRL